MKPIITKEKEEALDRAAGLLEALLDERVPAKTKAKIQQWFVSDMSKAEKYDALKKLFVELSPNLHRDEYELEQYRKIAELLGFEEEAPMPAAKPAAKRRLNLKRYAMRAAAVLFPVFIAYTAYLWVGTEETTEQYPLANVSVSVKENWQKRVVLPDGSQVWLHSSSNLSYNDDFSQNRFVTLDGEAFFSVVHDSGRPFQVNTDNFSVKVLGTEFNICSYRENPMSEVILTSGSVQVAISKKRTFELTPNQRLTLDNHTLNASIDMVNGNIVSQGQVRDLRFVDTPLEEAVRKIGIYYGLEVSMPDWKPTDDLINLDFDRELSLGQVLEAICNITDNFTYLITDNAIVIEQTL